MSVDLDAERILRVLMDHNVRFILIGGLAANVHGSVHLTTDVDITPAADAENLRRLSSALKELGARIRSDADPEGFPFADDAESLARGQIWNLQTNAGDLDISVVPSGTDGYPDLIREALEIELDGIHIVVASLADIIRSKQAANRPKDQLTLPTLRRLLEEEQRRAR